MSALAVIHISQKLWIIGGVLTLVFYRKTDPKGIFKSGYTEMITISGPTTNKLIMWLIGNIEKTDPEKFNRIITEYYKEVEEQKLYKEHKRKLLEKENKKKSQKLERIKNRKHYKRLNNIPLY